MKKKKKERKNFKNIEREEEVRAAGANIELA